MAARRAAIAQGAGHRTSALTPARLLLFAALAALAIVVAAAAARLPHPDGAVVGHGDLRAHLGRGRRPDGLQLVRQRLLLRGRHVCLRRGPVGMSGLDSIPGSAAAGVRVRRRPVLAGGVASRPRSARAAAGACCRGAGIISRSARSASASPPRRSRPAGTTSAPAPAWSLPSSPADIEDRPAVLLLALACSFAALTFFTLRWLYAGRFGLAINAIRDDEDKAEAMGLRTTRYKTIAWCVSAFFLGMAGALVRQSDALHRSARHRLCRRHLRRVDGADGDARRQGHACRARSIGAVVFHVTQELFWTYLLGWQRVALGLLIVLIVCSSRPGHPRLLRERRPVAGHHVEEATSRPSGVSPMTDALLEVTDVTKALRRHRRQ